MKQQVKQNMLVLQSRPYFNFVNSIRSPQTKRFYVQYLARFMSHCGILNHDKLLELPVKRIEELLIEYVVDIPGFHTKRLTLCAVKKFFDMNDVILNWKKLSCFIGEYQRVKKDRAYTHEEIRILLNTCDLRMKTVVLLLASTGMRIGALCSIKLKHLERSQSLYKITVYENSHEEYFTFCSPECSGFLDDYIKFRKRSGEKVSSDSPLIRKQFDMNDLEQIRMKSEPVSTEALSRVLALHLQKCGLRTVNHSAVGHRKDVARAHGFRKFFTTQLVNSKVNPEIREMLLGHRIALASAYYKPTEEDILNEYVKALDNLTINEENRLKRKVEKLEGEQNEIAQMRLKHENEMMEMRHTIDKILSLVQENPKLANVKKEVLRKI